MVQMDIRTMENQFSVGRRARVTNPADARSMERSVALCRGEGSQCYRISILDLKCLTAQ